MTNEENFSCKVCGAQVKRTQTFCQNCGRALEWKPQPVLVGKSANQQINRIKQKNWVKRHELIFAALVIICVIGAVIIFESATNPNPNNIFAGSSFKITADNGKFAGNPAASTATYIVYATVQNDGNTGSATFNCTLTLQDLSTVSQSQTVSLAKGGSETISFTFYNLNWENLPTSYKFQWVST
jgi:hypothetical protein